RVLEALVPAILEQKVVGLEAFRAWRLLLTRFGGPAPGPAPAGRRVCPPPAVWTAIPSWEWHRAGVEGVRARTVAAAARVGGRLEEILELAAGPADRRLRSLPGIGPWTSAEVRQRGSVSRLSSWLSSRPPDRRCESRDSRGAPAAGGGWPAGRSWPRHRAASRARISR